jgi:hypothetical protein
MRVLKQETLPFPFPFPEETETETKTCPAFSPRLFLLPVKQEA